MTNKVDFLAREPHHELHAFAIYRKIPVEHRGHFVHSEEELFASKNKYVAVFSYGDLKIAHRSGKKIIFGDHGTGMFYNIEHPSYAGSTAYRNNIVLRLSPNKIHATKEKSTLSCPVSTIGVPKMDDWSKQRGALLTQRMENPDMIPTIAVSFHWDCLVCPETRSAYKEFLPELCKLSKTFKIIGHGHPRIMDILRTQYRRHHIEIVADFSRVLREADMYVCDNSSTIYEFAYLRKPVILLNSKHYRKGVEHAGNPRFWKHANIGPQVDNPADLSDAFVDTWNDFESYLPAIDLAVKDVFTYVDGRSGERAAQAILNVMQI